MESSPALPAVSPTSADPSSSPAEDRSVIHKALCDFKQELSRVILPDITKKIQQETQAAFSAHMATLVSDQVRAVSADLDRSLDSKLDDRLGGFQDRLKAIEDQRSQPMPDAEDLSARLQNLQFSSHEASNGILARLERIELKLK